MNLLRRYVILLVADLAAVAAAVRRLVGVAVADAVPCKVATPPALAPEYLGAGAGHRPDLLRALFRGEAATRAANASRPRKPPGSYG